jgi:hypothetical protein
MSHLGSICDRSSIRATRLAPPPSVRRLEAWQRVASAAFAVLLIGLLVTACLLNPDPSGQGTHRQLGLLPCSFKMLWEIPCPVCGMTTSWAHFVRGAWSLSAQANIGGFALALCACGAIGTCVRAAWTGRPATHTTLWTFALALISVLAISLTQWAIRLS